MSEEIKEKKLLSKEKNSEIKKDITNSFPKKEKEIKKTEIQKYIEKLLENKSKKIPCLIDTEKDLNYYTLIYKKISFWEYGFDFEKKTPENSDYKLKIKIEEISQNQNGKYFLIGKLECIDNSFKILAINGIGNDFVKFGYNSGGHKICVTFFTEYLVRISTVYYDSKGKECFYYWDDMDFKLEGKKNDRGKLFEIYFKL